MIWLDRLFGLFMAGLFITIIVLVGKLMYWGVHRGHCVSRTETTISICLAWESDLDTPELKQKWQQWKQDHPNQNLD